MHCSAVARRIHIRSVYSGHMQLRKANLTGVSPLEPLWFVRVLARTRIYKLRNIEAALLRCGRRGLLDWRLRNLLGLVVHCHQVVEHSIALLKLALLLDWSRGDLDMWRLDWMWRHGLVLRLWLRYWLWKRVHGLGREWLGCLCRRGRSAEHIEKILNGLWLHRLWLSDWLHGRWYLNLRHLRNVWE